MSIRFDQPEFLWLAALIVPLLVLGWRSLASNDLLRRGAALGLRAALMLALVAILAGPRSVQEHDHLTVIGLLDISGSVQRFADLPPVAEADTKPGQRSPRRPPPRVINGSKAAASDAVPVRRSNIEYLRQWFRRATQTKAPDDRFGLVVFDGRAIAISAPTRADYTDDSLDVAIAPGTNIAEAVRLGLAMFPADTAKRLVLVSDGNQTAGDVLDAVAQAAGGSVDFGFSILDFELRDSAAVLNGATDAQNASNRPSKIQNPKSKIAPIPIDVLPIAYHVTGDVQVARVEAPPTAQPGQTVMVRVILEAASPASGSLTLLREGEPVDLNGETPGRSRAVALPAGQSVHLAQVTLGETPINRFEVVFEPDDPTADALPDNNRAEAFTATPSEGSVLVLDAKMMRRPNELAAILTDADLPVHVRAPAEFPADLLSLQNFDLIVLDNIAAYELSRAQHEMIARYVNDLGGGLIMVGGDNSFGAGGWSGTEVAKLLPVEVDPSKELRLPTAALVLVLDKSGSMNQQVAGARKSQQEIANEGAALAIESLRADSLVGVVTFDMFSHTTVPLQPNENPRALANRVRGINAEGGTNMEPALRKAYEMLKDAKVAKKHIVCMSDGRSHSTDFDDVLKKLNAANIKLTTIAVGDDADYEMLEALAQRGDGKFYPVRDPRKLPLVLIDSVQTMNKPLLKFVPFTPKVLATGSTLTAGMEDAPILDGLVITAPRKDPKVALEMLDPDGAPLLAHWQVGLGRVAAFTSEAPSRQSDGGGGVGAAGGAGNGWAERWRDWPVAATFWTQLARSIARPAASHDAELSAIVRDERLELTLEMAGGADETGGFMDYLQVEGTVYAPDGATVPVRLRQVAPGRYETSLDATQAGNYIVALNPRQGTRQLAPVIGGASRSTSPEFRRYQSNIALLDEIAERSDGRRLDVSDPLAVNLFDRTNMPVSETSLPAWRNILWFALLLVLLDVACRRIAWNYALLRSALARAVARITPAHVRGRQAEATLATLRRVSDDVESRQEAEASGITRFKPTGKIAPPPERIIPREDASQPPDQSRVSAALDALLGRKGQAAPPEPPPPAPPEPGDEAAATTSSLLAAKRRARERLSGGGDASADQLKDRS